MAEMPCGHKIFNLRCRTTAFATVCHKVHADPWERETIPSHYSIVLLLINKEESETSHGAANYDGKRINYPGHPAVYLVDNGRKKLIPNPQVYENLFASWNDIIKTYDTSNTPDGLKLSYGSSLVEEEGKPAIYFIDRGCLRHIPNPDIFNKYGFNNRKIRVYSSEFFHETAKRAPLW